MGIGGESGKDTITMANGHDVIWDHCSLSWGRDGTFDRNQETAGPIFYNLTLQRLHYCRPGAANDPATGGLVGTQATSIIRSLYIDNNSETPRARRLLRCSSSTTSSTTGWCPVTSLGDTSGRLPVDMSRQLLRLPWTGNQREARSTMPDARDRLRRGANFHDSNRDGCASAVRLSGLPWSTLGTATWGDDAFRDLPAGLPALTADAAMNHVRAHAGASRFRDESRLLTSANELRLCWRRRARRDRRRGELGLTGGVGTIPGVGQVPADSDRDGMPDAWELAHGPNPNTAPATATRQIRSQDRWTNLEEICQPSARPADASLARLLPLIVAARRVDAGRRWRHCRKPPAGAGAESRKDGRHLDASGSCRRITYRARMRRSSGCVNGSYPCDVSSGDTSRCETEQRQVTLPLRRT